MSKMDVPVVSFASADAFEKWLKAEHASSDGVWLKLAKKGASTTSISYADALEVALCYGWIDGQKDKLDDQHWLQRFTPRKSKSRWSKINRDKALALIDQGRMRSAGLREVERAKADGRWEVAYEGQRTATVPEDLQGALDKNKKAREFFATLDGRNRYAILYRVQDAKKAETRAQRIHNFVEMLSQHKTVHPRG
jgi:uncharacterized protein YdeI (YjbR/CyaY-like superfamily)